jgi:hypothetical protein
MLHFHSDCNTNNTAQDYVTASAMYAAAANGSSGGTNSNPFAAAGQCATDPTAATTAEDWYVHIVINVSW